MDRQTEVEQAIVTAAVDVGATTDITASSAEPRKRGRPKGAKNKVTKEMQNLARRLIRDSAYRKKFKADWQKRKNIAPAIEQMMYFYAGGKPPDQVEVGSNGEQAPTAFVLVLNGQVLTPQGPDSDNGSGQ